MEKKIAVVMLAGAVAAAAACGGTGATDAGNGTGTGMTLGISPDLWTGDGGVRVANSTSSSTVLLPDGTYLMYTPIGGEFASADGLFWNQKPNVVLPENPTFNPAVIRLSSGTFVMIYEAGHTTASPVGGKFYRATSTNGITFTKTTGAGTGGAVMEPNSSDNNFISVPDLILLPDGRLRMYFVAFGDHIEAAVSSDLGISWTREGRISINGLSSGRLAVDPDILATTDGKFRLYFTAPKSGTELTNKSILSASSSDGINFLLESGDRLSAPDATSDLVDPDVVRLANGTLRMYFGAKPNEQTPYSIKSAVSQ